MKYAYPAIFTKEEGDTYSVLFSDLDGCYTCGENLEDAIEMAEDVLAFTLYRYEKDGRPIPAPSDRNDIVHEECEFINYIACDTLEYQKRNNNKAVKKTLTIPQWLNEEATARGVNFSQVLQDGLKARLGL